jgi:anti-anti-sigma factor
MRIESTGRKDVLIFRIKDDLTIDSDLSEIVSMVKAAVENGQYNIVLSFTQESYLCTRSIAVITQCRQMLEEKRGTLGIVATNGDIRDLLETIGISSLVRIYGKEDEVGT